MSTTGKDVIWLQLCHDSLIDAKGLPLLATRTLAIVSGMLVPAASSVRPIIVSGIRRVSPVIRKNPNQIAHFFENELGRDHSTILKNHLLISK